MKSTDKTIKKSKEPSDSDIKKFLTYQVKISGFSLENDVGRFLKQKYLVNVKFLFMIKMGKKVDHLMFWQESFFQMHLILKKTRDILWLNTI